MQASQPAEPNAASVALIRDGEVLLIQRAFEPFKGMWTLPGGRREPGESIGETARRELLEELGLAVTDLQPVLLMGVGHGFRLRVFASDRFQGEISPSTEIAAWQWARPGAIGSLATTPELSRVLGKAMALFDGDDAVSASR
jgi:8-oxo-dGTP diphosphatase